MSNVSSEAQVPTLGYAGPQTNPCPVCHKNSVWKKKLYNEQVCKKCYYGFLNRRQLAYIVDLVCILAIALPLGYGVGTLIAVINPNISDVFIEIIFILVGIPISLLFAMRDGLGGQSLGKRLTGVQVVDVSSYQPIGPIQSLKRNLYLAFEYIPVAGRLVLAASTLIILIQMGKGPRLGDRFAKTRVIWKKYQRSRLFGGDGLTCQSCGYDLTGNVSGKCPECGKDIPPEVQSRLTESMLQPAASSAPITP